VPVAEVLRGLACGPVQERLTAQPTRDGAGFGEGCLGGFGVVQADEVLDLVEQAVAEVIGVLSSRRPLTAAANAVAAAGSPSLAARRALTRPRSARSIGARCAG
jgi:hypothetical protein